MVSIVPSKPPLQPNNVSSHMRAFGVYEHTHIYTTESRSHTQYRR
jgi:hypothetical protein